MPPSKNFPPIPEGKTKYKVRFSSPLSPDNMRRGEWGHRNWTLSTLWDPVISQVLGSADDVNGEIPMSKRNFQDLINAGMEKISYDYSPVQKNNFVVLVKETHSPACANKILLSTRSYIYSWFSNRIEINVQLLPYQQNNVEESDDHSPPMSPRHTKLVAFGELAQLLAIKVELNDLLIISGHGVSLRDGQSKIYLNGNAEDDNNNNKGHNKDSSFDIIHYPFQTNEENLEITMMEQVEPHSEKLDYFLFTYNSSLARPGRETFFKQVVLHRPFTLSEYLESGKSIHSEQPEPFRIPISSNPLEAFKVYGDMTFSTLGAANFENKWTEKRLNEKLAAQSAFRFRARAKFVVYLGILPLMALIYYMDPDLINSWSQYIQLSEN